MNNKILYANGCSFTNGVELYTQLTSFTKEQEIGRYHSASTLRELGMPEQALYNEQHRYTHYLAQELGYEEVNGSESGCDNYRIAERTIRDLDGLLSQGVSSKDVFVIIGWSDIQRFPSRRCEWSASTIPFANTPEDEDQKNITTLAEIEYGQHAVDSFKRYLRALSHLRTYLTVHGFKYLFLNMLFDTRTKKELKRYANHIPMQLIEQYFSTSDFIDGVFDNIIAPIDLIERLDGSTMLSFLSRNQLDICSGGHPGKETHYQYANYLIEHVRRRL